MPAFSLERYSARNSPVHRLDARVKLALLLVFIACVVSLPLGRWLPLSACGALVLLSAAIGRVPARALLRQTAVLLPVFGGIALASLLFGARGGARAQVWLRFADLAARILLILLAAIVVNATTPPWRLSRALQGLRVPALLATLFAFAARYALLLIDNVLGLHRALAARGGPPRSLRRLFRVLAQGSASLLLRTYERAEQVAIAMEARGYDGAMRSLPQPRPAPSSIAVGALTATLLLALAIWPRWP